MSRDADGKDAMLDKGSVVAGNEPIHRHLLKLLKTAGAAHDIGRRALGFEAPSPP